MGGSWRRISRIRAPANVARRFSSQVGLAMSGKWLACDRQVAILPATAVDVQYPGSRRSVQALDQAPSYRRESFRRRRTGRRFDDGHARVPPFADLGEERDLSQQGRARKVGDLLPAA